MTALQSKRPSFVHKLAIRNYKSIESTELTLQPFTVLVGPNGAGKSNILDALRFVSESLRNSLEYALRDRGGVQEVRRRSKGHPRSFGLRLHLNLSEDTKAEFAFQVGTPKGKTRVTREICSITSCDSRHYYDIRDGKLIDSSDSLQSEIEPDRLYLQAVSAVPAFRSVYRGLSRMGFYNLNPNSIRELQSPDPAEVLARDGGNIAGILKRLQLDHADAKRRIEEYLEAVVPGIRGVESKPVGPKETVEFRQKVPGDENPWRFYAASMSDGTLRVLGVLVALFQSAYGKEREVPLVGIEEPESALHPAAANVLAGAIQEASANTQILITSHSPDLLENAEIDAGNIVGVFSDQGRTIAGQIGAADRAALREKLYSPGELLRVGQLEPARDIFKKSDGQLQLFPKDLLL